MRGGRSVAGTCVPYRWYGEDAQCSRRLRARRRRTFPGLPSAAAVRERSTPAGYSQFPPAAARAHVGPAAVAPGLLLLLVALAFHALSGSVCGRGVFAVDRCRRWCHARGVRCGRCARAGLLAGAARFCWWGGLRRRLAPPAPWRVAPGVAPRSPLGPILGARRWSPRSAGFPGACE